jgi:hypothetical protein
MLIIQHYACIIKQKLKFSYWALYYKCVELNATFNLILFSVCHFIWGSKVQIPRNQFGLIWSKLNPWFGPCLGPACILILQIMNFPLSSLFWCEPIDFPSKMEPCRCRLDLPVLGLAPSFKRRGSNLWFLANRIVLFH